MYTDVMKNASRLEQCVDFILNQCDGKELDVIIAAVERRKTNFAKEFSFDSEAASKKISQEINASISALAEKWIPDMSFDGSVKPLTRDGKVSGIPADVLYDMTLQFIGYGTGKMSNEKNNELKNSMGNWQEKYWNHFPTKVRQTIKTFFDGQTTFGECTETLKQLLGLVTN